MATGRVKMVCNRNTNKSFTKKILYGSDGRCRASKCRQNESEQAPKKQMYLIHLVSGPGDARNAPQTEVHHLHNLQRNWEE